MLEVSWEEFQNLELWQIRSRAFVQGENIAARKAERLNILMDAQFSWASEKPGAAQQECLQSYFEPVIPKQQLSPEEADRLKRKHNQQFFDKLKAQYGG